MKSELILLYFSLFLTFSEAKHKSYGGKMARAGQFPFVVSLSFEDQHYCGASIIHERWVLTAAHCIFNEGENWYYLTEEAQVKVRSGIIYEIEEIYKHPAYKHIPEDENDGLELCINDIGLIRLSTNVTFNDKVQPITLSTREDSSYKNTMATLPGWGLDKHGGERKKFLHYITVRVLSHKECRKVWTYADKHLCTSNQEKQGACYGDSGSPLVVGDMQIGIVSTADTYCQSLKPDLYTDVTSYVPWIKSIMGQYGDVLQLQEESQEQEFI